MPTPLFSQKLGRNTWINSLGEQVPIEVYNGKPPKSPVNLSLYLKNGYAFSEQRKDQIIKLRKKREKSPEEAAENLLKSIFPNF